MIGFSRTQSAGIASEPAERLAMAGLSLSMLMASLDTSIANAGLPTLARALNASFQQAQWIVLAYLLAVTALIVSVGRLGDIAGRKRLLVTGISLFTGISLLCGLAPSLWVLLAARALQGLGAAVMMALTIAFVGEAVPKERIGRAMGLLGTMSAIGTAAGPSLGGFLISSVGWRAIFLVNAPVGIVAIYLASRYLPADGSKARDAKPAFDVLGTIILAMTLAAYSLAMTLGRGNFGALNVGLLAVTGLGLVLFGFIQARGKAPLLELKLFQDRKLTGSLLMSALVSTVLMSTLVVGPFYLTRALALNPALVGLILSIGPLVVVGGGVPAGRLADRFGPQRVALLGLYGIALGSALLALLPRSFGITGYVVPIAVLTAGYALFQTANNTSVMAGVSPNQRGVISGILSLSRNMGLITGASVLGAVFATASGATDVALAKPEAVSSGLRATFAVATAFILIAIAIALYSRRIKTSRA